WTRKEESEAAIVFLSQFVHFLVQELWAQMVEIADERQWERTLRIPANVAVEDNNVDEETSQDVKNHL
ncbi:hypothetical protein PMAYCL1PPCAC_14974, partial [Pristionchus mayeri]